MKLLVYQDKRFVDLETGTSYPSAHAEPEGLVVGLTDQAHPLWCCVQEDLVIPEALRDNWSVGLARCNTTEELAASLQQLTREQFEYVLKTLPLHLLEDFTGLQWPLGFDGMVFEATLNRSHDLLQRQGITIHRVEAKSSSPLNFAHAQCINAHDVSDHVQAGASVGVQDVPVHPGVQQALQATLPKDGGLYLHQLQALNFIQRSFTEGFDVMLTTPTASGKTMAFLPGVAELLLQDPFATALFLYPLRALVQDQHEKIKGFCEQLPDLVAVQRYMQQDQLSDDKTRLLIATPDKINHNLTRKELRHFFRNLRVVVLDEAHVYKGVFGMNMAFLLRRLFRLCDRPPKVVVSSATLQNTVDFARKLTGRERFKVVGASSAPRHARYHYVAHDLPVSGNRPIQHYQKDFRELYRDIQGAHKALLFVPGRSDATQVVRALPQGPQFGGGVALYSGVKDFARILEQFKGEQKGQLAASTTSLEAGVDIGDLGVVGVVTFPSSRNTFKQMAGRAGRTDAGHVIYYPGTRPADQYYLQDWALNELLRNESDPVYLNTLNTRIMKSHLRRACFEAEKHMLPHGPALLGDFLPRNLMAVRQERIESEVQEAFEGPFDDAAPPPLRNIPGMPHFVVRTGGERDPNMTIAQLELSENDRDDFLLEKSTLYNAHREWAPENVVLRGERYYEVLDWVPKKVQQSGFVQDGVVIWVRDITDQLAPPDHNLLAHRNQQVLAEDLLGVEHYHVGMLEVTAKIAEEHHHKTLGAITARSGDGQVQTHMLTKRTLVLPQVSYQCPTTLKNSKVKLLGTQVRVQVVDSQEQPLRDLGVFAGTDLQRLGRYAMKWPAYGGDVPGMETWLVHARTGRLQGSVQMVEHQFDGRVPGRCSCGRETERIINWTGVPQDVPPVWYTHPVFSMVPRVFDTHLCEITFSHGSIQALRAVANALMKAAPAALEIDPGDLGFFASITHGEMRLTLYDTLEGGAGISLEIPQRLQGLLEHTRLLLKRSLQCRCEGLGCYACILPFDPVEIPLQPEAFPEELIAGLEVATLDVAAATLALPAPPSTGQPVFRKLFTELLEVWDKGDEKHLKSLFALRPFKVQVVTDLKEEDTHQKLSQFPAEVQKEMLRNVQCAVGKPYPQRMQHLVDDDSPDQLVLLGTRVVDVQAAHHLGVVSMLGSWGTQSRDALRAGPDLVVGEVGQVQDALCDPDPYRWPLEQPRDLAVKARAVRLTSESGMEHWTLCRYLPAKARRSLHALSSATNLALGFKYRAMSVQTIASWIHHHFPGHDVVTVPCRQAEPNRGLERLKVALKQLGHPCWEGLSWGEKATVSQKQAGGLAARLLNVEGAFVASSGPPLRLLLVDDVLTTGATLHEAQKVLLQHGHQVEVLAVATTLKLELEGP